MTLVSDWKQGWKWLSVQFVTAAGIVQAAFLAYPDVLRAYLPDWMTQSIGIALLVAAIAGRFIAQPAATATPE